MKRRISLYIAVLTVVVATTIHPVAAQEAMTDAHVQHIKQSCSDARVALQQLHANDALVRVNRGQIYNSISTRLMAPLNSRLASNHYNASSLVEITVQYDKALTQFQSDYIAYDNQMGNVLGTDCQKQPVSFYDAVATARQQRETVHQDVTTLNQLLSEYNKAFDTFRTNYKTGTEQGDAS